MPYRLSYPRQKLSDLIFTLEKTPNNKKTDIYEKINNKFIFQDHLMFKDKAEIIAYVRKQDPNIDLNKYINFRDEDGNWIT